MEQIWLLRSLLVQCFRLAVVDSCCRSRNWKVNRKTGADLEEQQEAATMECLQELMFPSPRDRWSKNSSARRREPLFVGLSLPRLLCLLLLCSSTSAQIGESVCTCQPSAYTMQFNFAKTCENTAINGDGVAATDCAIAPFQNQNVTDLAPVTVGSIDILELDKDLVLLTQSSTFGTYLDGDTFNYTSISNDPSKVDGNVYPTALQISVIGNNKDGETLFFAGLLIFVTDCSVYPTLREGSSVGWVTFTELTPPQPEVCPIVGTRSPSESRSPTRAPTGVVETPTYSPTTFTAPPDGSGDKKPSSSKTNTKPPAHLPTNSPVNLEPQPPVTDSPTCNSSGKGKGKKSKSSKSKSRKGKGGVRGSSSSNSRSHKKRKKGSHKNVFDHDECDTGSGKSHRRKSGGKAKGNGSYYDEKISTYEPSQEVTLVATDESDSFDRFGDFDIEAETLTPTGGSIVITLEGDGGESNPPDLSVADSRAEVGGKNSFVRFLNSPIYLGVLIGFTFLAVAVAVFVFRHDRNDRDSSSLTPEERRIALMKGLATSSMA